MLDRSDANLRRLDCARPAAAGPPGELPPPTVCKHKLRPNMTGQTLSCCRLSGTYPGRVGGNDDRSKAKDGSKADH